jgi:hypothetical protein
VRRILRADVETDADAVVDRIINRAHKIALRGPTKRKDETITT